MNAFAEYLESLGKALARGDSTEHTHRPTLKTLLESVGQGVTATNEPRRIRCGSPDFQVTRGPIPLGHVETKDVGTNLDEMERGKGPHGEQFKRYLDGLPNWILTDYLQFRWFVNGEKRLSVCLAERDADGKIKPLPDGEQKLEQLLGAFLSQPAFTLGTAKDLAARMAGMTRIIRDLIVATFEHEREEGWLHNWLGAFRETLIPDLAEKPFADMFAQTLAYGMFAASLHAPPGKPFSREMAAYNLPKTNPFLRKLFAEIAGVDMPDSIGWAVDDIIGLLNHADMTEILKHFGRGEGKKDPVLHFYETFLTAYDPKMRKFRGVYGTPEPAVSYIVRSVDYLLKTRFKRPKGLADENTLILDPATGTATFLYFVIDQIHQKFARQAGAWDGYVAKHLLNRIFGFELLMAPYAIAHLKLGIQLQDTGYKFESDQRLGIYLTNTLEGAAKKAEHLFAGWVADEANAAAEIKRDKKIMVVLGNPPYSGHSVNRSVDENGHPTFIGKLLFDYRFVDGKPLAERNSKWIQDDYVKFIRFAQWRIQQTNYGIVGFITNHAYLDNPTFRGMRQNLLGSFDEIYVYDLHGNSTRRETAPGGGKDENVFNIRQGVAILFCVKLDRPPCRARVYHANLWGKRERKYAVLNETDIRETKWKEVIPISPTYLFVPHDARYRDEYERGTEIADIFPANSMGITTGNDDLYVAFTREELLDRFPEELSDVEVAYRPFDNRHLQYDVGCLARARECFMRQVTGGTNLVLLALRRPRNRMVGNFLVSRGHTDKCAISSLDNAQMFPLYIYETEKKKTKPRWDKALTTFLFEEQAVYAVRHPNLSPLFLSCLAEALGLPQVPPDNLPKGISPEDIFHYAYAVFHSPAYRTRYAEFLKIDFPRLPLTSDVKLFRVLAAKGAELVALHLLESPKLGRFVTDWPVKGDNVVESVRYTDKDKRVWISPTQYFGGVPKAVWEFHVGGYQVCEKWLKDRRGRTLTYDDIQHYQKIVVALKRTIDIMADIDTSIEDHGGWPLK